MRRLRESRANRPRPQLVTEPNPIEVFENEGGKTYGLDTVDRFRSSSERRARDRLGKTLQARAPVS